MGTFVGREYRVRWRVTDAFDTASILLIAGLAVTALVTFRHYSISNDEEVQHRYGELIVAYYTSGFTDQRLFGYKNLYLYGGLFDIVAVLLAKLLPFDPTSIRHLLTAIIGIGGIAATGATARLIAGSRAGFLAAAALAVCAPWYGAMFNHTKDIPFAAAMIASTYFLCRIARDLPKPRWGDVLGFGLMLGCALGLRAMGFLLVIYACVAVAVWMPWHGPLRDRLAFVLRSGVHLLPALVLAYAIMLAAWPWASLHILNPLRAILAFAHFHYEIRTMVAGEVYKMADVPWWYVPVYVAIKLPPLILVGAAAGIALAVWPRGSGTRRRETAFVACTALFPLLCQAIGHGPAFTGMRHFLYVVPPLAVLTGIALDALISRATRIEPRVALCALGAVAAALIWHAAILVQLHPYEYLFYNPLVGGLEGAARRYEMDYWVNIMSEAVNNLAAYVDRQSGSDATRKFTVGVCGERYAFEQYAEPRLQWTPGWLEADFFIAPTHMNCDRLVEGRIVYTIERFGVPIGVVKDRRGFVQRALSPAGRMEAKAP